MAFGRNNVRLGAILCATLALSSSVAIAANPQQQKDNSVGRAASQPLRDTRIKEDKIPDVLLLAASAPYSSVNTQNCAMITREVNRLNAVLGPDVDAPAQKKGEGSAVAAAAARGVVSSFIPGLGLVRVITGADRAQRRAEAAVYAGSVRRGYLKGLGRAKGCRGTAAPRPAAVADRPELPRDDKD
ncbi:MAG: hypothetical protein B7Y98_12140 [Sphingomonas sp. 32-62-10]|nr:MAG: hypothetical protein B7Z43_10845 [Sphingomonas sp. 12-62-6]OYX37490.1 MAG: hypothetical protein B7Y98_12140 [Sphingomonas sp. 32-62-10]